MKPITRNNLIKKLKKLGFSGPYSGGKHQFMINGSLRLAIPNPHTGDIGIVKQNCRNDEHQHEFKNRYLRTYR